MKILVSAYTGLGNLILKTPLLKAIKTVFPNCELTLFIGELSYLKDLLGEKSIVDHYLEYDENLTDREKRKIIRKEKHEYLFLPFDAQPGIFVKSIKAKNFKTIFRHYHESKNPLLTLRRKLYNRYHWVPVRKAVHEIELNLDLLQPIIKNVKPDLETFVPTDNSTAILDRFQINEPYFVIQPEAANGTDPTKCWHKDHFVLLIKELLQNYRHDIILVGDKADYKASIKYIEDHFPGEERLIVTAGGTNINELKNILEHSNLTICHDSGIMHLADALNRTLIALFGPSDFARVRPTKATSEVLFSQTEYFNIKEGFKSFSVKDLNKHQSPNYPMSGIKVQDVLLKMREIFDLDAEF